MDHDNDMILNHSDNAQECGFIPMSLVRRSWSRGIRLDRQTLSEVLTFAPTEPVSCPCSHGYLDSSSIRAILHTWRAVPWKHYKNPEASGRFPANLLFPFLPIRKIVSPWVECQCWEPPWASAWAAWTAPSLSLCGEPTTSPASLSNTFKLEWFLPKCFTGLNDSCFWSTFRGFKGISYFG